MAIAYPTTPADGEIFRAGIRSWVYHATPGVWKQQAAYLFTPPPPKDAILKNPPAGLSQEIVEPALTDWALEMVSEDDTATGNIFESGPFFTVGHNGKVTGYVGGPQMANKDRARIINLHAMPANPDPDVVYMITDP